MRKHSQELDSIANNVRKHIVYRKTTKEHNEKEDSKYNKMKTKYSIPYAYVKNVKSAYGEEKDSDSLKNTRKHIIYPDNEKYGKINSRYNIKAKYSKPEINMDAYDKKDFDSTSEESSLDLTADEADLEVTLTRIKLKAGTDKEDTKLEITDLKTQTLLDSFQSEYSNLKESYSISDTKTESDSTTDSHVKKRQKRFINIFKASETTENENFLFRILEFLNKNRKSVIPVFTVMREINTLVKSANGELNHSTKERNNFIGHNAPVLPIATYNLELGSDSKVKAFVKKLLGLKVEGDRLTITGK